MEGPCNGGMLYHEVQESKLCAVHCVNTVLQGPFFSEFDLAAVASDLDSKERQMMLEGGGGVSGDFLQFDAEGSHNVSMDGDFSIQVLEKALEVWDLQVIPLDCPAAEPAQYDPQLENAFICHLQDHWFCIRKVDGEWYNFDSLYAAPEHLSKFYLSAYLDTLKGFGWSIFIVRGNFPRECPTSFSEASNGFGQWLSPEDAQRITKSCNMTQPSPRRDGSTTVANASEVGVIEAEALSEMEEKELNEAIAASLMDSYTPANGTSNEVAQEDNKAAQSKAVASLMDSYTPANVTSNEVGQEDKKAAESKAAASLMDSYTPANVTSNEVAQEDMTGVESKTAASLMDSYTQAIVTSIEVAQEDKKAAESKAAAASLMDSYTPANVASNEVSQEDKKAAESKAEASQADELEIPIREKSGNC